MDMNYRDASLTLSLQYRNEIGFASLQWIKDSTASVYVNINTELIKSYISLRKQITCGICFDSTKLFFQNVIRSNP